MHFDPVPLKPWLVRTLEPICDAEPGALADYILALLKHNVPESEMRNELAVQLDEFLEKECRPFLDILFTAIRTKSYLPYAAFPTSSTHPDMPPDVGSSPGGTRKRSFEGDQLDDRPNKGPRLSNGDGDSRWGGRGDINPSGYRDRDQPQHMNGGRRNAPVYAPPEQKRGICRDYHNNGYCSRGAYCKFSHGEDAVVPGQLFAVNGGGMPGVPFMPMFPAGFVSPTPAYDPHESRMDMRPTNGAVRPQPRAPLISRAQQQDGGPMLPSGELPVIQDLTPPTIDPQTQTQPPLMTPIPPENYNNNMPMDVDNSYPMGGPSRPLPFRGRGAPRTKGVFNGEVHKFNGERRNDKTLVVEKIPQEKLSLEAVNDWFKRFGTVTNVAIDTSGGKALVSFSNNDEARAAWKSEDAVFGNRFVKVFWHRPMEGQGQNGARMLAASAPIVANITTKPDPPVPTPPAPRPTSSVPRKAASTASTALAAKQQLLEKQIAEQKALMASLATASADEKKDIMAKLRKLGEEMTSAPKADDPASKERERLDKELELHSAVGKVESEETTEDLKAKLERLKEEAASLGLSESGPETSWNGASYRGYRGRGRGARSFYRGGAFARGGPPRGSMKLDNRPKKLLVKGAKEDSLQAVKDWYDTTGQVESVAPADDGDILVSFYSRAAAEQGLAKGQNISLVGPVHISWYTGAPSNSTLTKSDLPLDPPDERPPSPGLEEEEVAGGWGDGDDDGMGMP
ncbi:hypothetical protein MIND_00461700 [Mycena indigotica]|uniref:Uncharacterized protein n=1 Tax=Mycena indigotica TaxID=2126181 RepID=A0A8H6SZF2_9AGAR|nr:uncharacterized protein MIND_00461700 [Mycena indigotica]KAF7306700.1 hypothetical protein MIND_00461700 [Mycena indigotica]